MAASAWTEDRIGRLKVLWREGRSAEQIARDLANGITRNAVLGKVHRMGLSAGRPAVPKAAPRPSPERARLAKPAAPRPAFHDPDPAPERGFVTLLSVTQGQCRWPLGDPLCADFSLCGGRATRGAYCARHADIAYRRVRETPQTLERLARLN